LRLEEVEDFVIRKDGALLEKNVGRLPQLGVQILKVGLVSRVRHYVLIAVCVEERVGLHTQEIERRSYDLVIGEALRAQGAPSDLDANVFEILGSIVTTHDKGLRVDWTPILSVSALLFDALEKDAMAMH